MDYVDGYSLYRAYFLPNSLDPFGEEDMYGDDGDWIGVPINDFLGGGESNTWRYGFNSALARGAKEMDAVKEIISTQFARVKMLCALSCLIGQSCPSGSYSDSGVYMATQEDLNEFKRGLLGGSTSLQALLGSYPWEYTMTFDCSVARAQLIMHVTNVYSMESATRNPMTRVPYWTRGLNPVTVIISIAETQTWEPCKCCAK